ncbi:DUF6221 family protein [Streptomyces sp. SID14515]|uniref:DUF6221 family protein n=1 Tax=Streptomyces sp. SID14515 TaxID=2706074 RepID=UPI0013C99F2F|nr:DUF6221 family protein [Streptomyces sp. SID14515]NEB42284.1 hypothetical protein [Streptomyces sp. SID14515]
MTAALVAFLKARLEDDEWVARGSGQPSLSWQNFDMDGELRDDANAGTVAMVPREETRAHFARQDPAHTLREVDAKHQLLDAVLADRHHVSADQYETCPRATAADGLDETTLAALDALNAERRHEDGVEPECWESCGRDARVRRTLELLALPYIDHPGYEEALRP